MGKSKNLGDSAPGLWRIAHFFSAKMGAYRLLLTGSFIALLCEILFVIAAPWPLKFLIDHLIIQDPSAGDVLSNPEILLILSAVAVVVIAGLKALASYFHTIGFALIGSRVLATVRQDLYQHLQTLSLSFHTKNKSGDLITRVINDLGIVKDVMINTVLPLFGSLVLLVSMFGIIFWLHWQLALIALAVIPLFGLAASYLGKRIQKASRKQRYQEGAMASTAAESIASIKTVQALSLDNKFAHSFGVNNRKDLHHSVRAKRFSALLTGTVGILIGVVTALVLWFGARLVLNNELSPGELLVILAYLKSAFKPVRKFSKQVSRLAKAATSGERVLDIFEQTPDICDLPHAQPAPPLQGHIRFEQVNFAYEAKHPVFQDLNFSVTAGQQIALVGASGSGKSTIISLLLRLYDPQSGRILIDGHDIRDFSVHSLRCQISVALQDSCIFATSVRNNIAYGISDASDAEIETAAKLANAHAFILSLPKGYDTVISERGATLSNGQRQRIALARTAMRRSPILILDEPTTGLDRENEIAVVDALKRLSKGRTTFQITHHLHHAMHADAIWMLEQGRIVEQGTHAELMQINQRYAAMFKAGLKGVNQEEHNDVVNR
ncbi:MAG: ABC transporter ATP-binding protein/permease [Gammaproteobacteria bacterium]|nr:ABC transporter ATP-binding protein/permease [Gammaproteobacteria bacterium]MCF6260125.1 ABC transporter ATP-binding protein/permease [Gammaproteobacteria bacterium]